MQMDRNSTYSQYFRKSKVLKLLVIAAILAAFALWAINISISEGIKVSYKSDSESFVQRFNSYLESIQTFKKEPTMKTFGDTQKHFGFLAMSIDKWDMSISIAIEKHALEAKNEDFLYESWPDIRELNEEFIESVIIQNNMLTYDQIEISEIIKELSSVFNSIKTAYKLN